MKHEIMDKQSEIPTKPALNDTLCEKIRKMYLFGMVELRYP